MTKPKLEPLPCPFCGSEGRIAWWSSASHTMYWIASCSSQKCIIWHEQGCTTAFHSEEAAIKAWNRRVTHPHELSGNTGELKQTKETPSDVISTIELNQLMLRAGGMEKEAALRVAEEIGRLESQLEDYRKAIEFLFKARAEPTSFFGGDNKERYQLGTCIGTDPLTVCNAAMAKEGGITQ